ncbi:MAG: hypothetical protein ABI622_07655 [Chloroflexota bacterium]
MFRRCLLLAAVTGLLGLMVAVPPMRVAACSCVTPDPAEAAQRVDAVFVGAVVDQRTTANGPVVSSGDPVQSLFAVEEVRKGPTVSSLVVATARDGASCGAGFAVNTRWLVYATRVGDGTYTSNLCEPNQLLSDRADLPDHPVGWPDEVAASPDANGAIPLQMLVMAAVVGALALGSAVAFLWKGRRPA